MNSIIKIGNRHYGICLNSCECQVFNRSRSSKTYEVIKRGSLAKFQSRKWKSGSVRTLVTNKSEVYMQNSLHYISIDFKLYKYLNAINDFEERVKFYTNYERRQFVLHLTRNSDVSVGFSSGQQTKAVFHEINENEEKIFITVELLEPPLKYSLPANMVNTIAFFDSTQRDKRCCFKKCLGPSTFNFDYSTLEYWRYDDNVQNGTTSNVSSKRPLCNKPSRAGLQRRLLMLDRSYSKASNDEPRNNFNGKTVGRNSKRDENRFETRVEVCHQCSNVRKNNICLNCVDETKNIFALNNSKTNVVINSKVCVECLNVYEGNICPRCDLEKISAQNNSLFNVDSNKSSYSSLFSETPKNSFEINHAINNWETNGDHLPYISKVAVKRNISESNCIICKNHLNISEGYELLCKHIFCETCIKNQMNFEMFADTNIMACCGQPYEQDEIKYLFPTNEYEQFKASYKQQCFDKHCSGYHLWEESGEEGLFTFTCNKCKLENCAKCLTIHVNLTCEQYDKIRNSVDNETVEVFLTWIREGIAMPCTNCEALIEKDEGCDWVQCPFCNIEICWATRGPRWGPNGKGDTSGGCGCDFKVKKCVENCNYCQ